MPLPNLPIELDPMHDPQPDNRDKWGKGTEASGGIGVSNTQMGYGRSGPNVPQGTVVPTAAMRYIEIE